MSLDSNLQSAFTAVGTVLKGKISSTEKGAANGVATLDGAGKLTSSQLPAFTVGGLVYQGVWDASTNTPTIPAASVNNKGLYFKVSVSGSTNISGITDWKVGDWIVSDGSVWDKIDNTDSVSSVAGKTGAVTLSKSDVGLENVNNTSDANKPVSTATQTALDLKVNAVAGKGLSTEDYTTAEKTKLSGISAGAQVNQFAFSNIAVSGQTTIGADSTTDTLTIVAGTNINITTDAVNDTITINSTANGVTNISTTHNASTVVIESDTGTDGTINSATTSLAGVMSSSDKTKLDGIESGAQVNSVSSVAGKTGAVTLSKSDVGLTNVNNTADIDKPISTATQTALDLKATASSVTTLSNNIGATNTDYVAVFNASLL